MNPDHINWTANFLGEATGIKADGIKSYILMTQPTQIVGDANAVIIGNNNVYKSDYISTISVTFDLIDDLDNLDPDILVPGTDTFNDYAVPFCEEVCINVKLFEIILLFNPYLTNGLSHYNIIWARPLSFSGALGVILNFYLIFR